MNAPGYPPKLFLSYRRHDRADATERLGERLKSHFGQDEAFIDVDAIPIGVDFRTHLENAVGRCDVLVAVIGSHWLNACFEHGPHRGQRRLDDPDDWVRIEIESALKRGIPVVPVLIGGTPMPSKTDLPDGLQELAHDGRVICVRLALFAEMVKGKPWTQATLKEVGGTEGVGVTFLEETFAASAAPPQHRLHQRAAQAVLKSLLPESGTDIKGHMRSNAELLEASGYAKRLKDFDDLIRILDGEIRLITPTDPEGKDDSEDRASQVEPGQKYYQLAHDYLVPSLRAWLTRKQKETRRGRAELLLADRASVWNARPENRQLPSLLQWLSIQRWTQKKNWSKPQRKMMRKAGLFHVVRGLVVAVVLVVGAFIGLTMREQAEERQKATKAAGLVQAVVNADTAQVPDIIRKMAKYRQWVDPLLREEYDKAAARSPQKLHASLALLPVDATKVDYLYQRLLDAEPHEVPVIRDALAPYQDKLSSKLWAVVETPPPGKEPQRLRAAAALAKYDPQNQKWATANTLVVNDLVRENAVFLGQWTEAFKFVKGPLLSPLSVIFRDHQPKRAAQRTLATNLLVDYAADQPLVLADLLMDGDETQFVAIFPKFKQHGNQGLSVLTGEIDKPQRIAGEKSKETSAKRQANAAVALLRLNHTEKVWPLLKHGPDPRVRSYLIHRFHPLGADPKTLFRIFQQEKDLSIQRALLLSLGDFEKELAPSVRESWLAELLETYRKHPDPGLHGAAAWLLRQWQQDDRLKKIDEALATGKVEGKRQWYVSKQGQTFAIIAPREFWMGSPPEEAGRFGGPTGRDEMRHWHKIGRSFAVATKEVTVAQFCRCPAFKEFAYNKVFAPTFDHPINRMTWYEAAEYCNWLSKEEGLEECYEPNAQGKYAEGMRMKANYLQLAGYRLPTEAEWEYACRAEAETSRFYGETEELLGKYAWYTRNSQDRWMLPMENLQGDEPNLQPNDFGLFHMLGNALEWCQDESVFYRPGTPDNPSTDEEDINDIKNGIFDKRRRVLRGGSFVIRASYVRSAVRDDNVPSYRHYNVGFRVARTLVSSQP